MKTKEELNALKEEVDTLYKKLSELNEDELKLVTGGSEDWRTHNGVDTTGYTVDRSLSAQL